MLLVGIGLSELIRSRNYKSATDSPDLNRLIQVELFSALQSKTSDLSY
jgi:hypothetical protein